MPNAVRGNRDRVPQGRLGASRSPGFTRSLTRLVSFQLLVASAIVTTASASSLPGRMDQAGPPEQTVKLIFIHHSTGENWLADDNGNQDARV